MVANDMMPVPSRDLRKYLFPYPVSSITMSKSFYPWILGAPKPQKKAGGVAWMVESQANNLPRNLEPWNYGPSKTE
jgi:hypothetical protein